MTLSSTLTDFSINVLIILPVPQDCSAQIRSVLLSIIDCTIYFVLWNGFLVRGRVGGPPVSISIQSSLVSRICHCFFLCL